MSLGEAALARKLRVTLITFFLNVHPAPPSALGSIAIMIVTQLALVVKMTTARSPMFWNVSISFDDENNCCG